ncbi:FAD-dependent oxidoreductase [Chryseobacterium taklimakanense]|uniref:FAD-binding oxidoreductase n=1 Tax=Chryseobacterium taklimakanense TaxID=536441 RepID=A0A3G8WWN6_9FLAO|nr:FAD-dependent oxidoreductase [Chryseobacterium taklimakanense]AZI20176.1 FAD-binding oxidoreductase [Chryseobacterium taklimakanense]
MNRDGNHKSFWQDAQKEHHNAKPTVNDFETIIVGAGITGISLAIELQRRGQKCLVLEKNTIGFGTTGGTTAFINNFLMNLTTASSVNSVKTKRRRLPTMR